LNSAVTYLNSLEAFSIPFAEVMTVHKGHSGEAGSNILQILRPLGIQGGSLSITWYREHGHEVSGMVAIFLETGFSSRHPVPCIETTVRDALNLMAMRSLLICNCGCFLWLLLHHMLLLIQPIDHDFDLRRFQVQMAHRRRETLMPHDFLHQSRISRLCCSR
jgi:hypothetical protein